jgi:hypothetical protein
MNGTGKLDTPISKTGLFGFANSDGSQGHRRCSTRGFYSSQATSDRRVGKNHDKLKELQERLLGLIASK